MGYGHKYKTRNFAPSPRNSRILYSVLSLLEKEIATKLLLKLVELLNFRKELWVYIYKEPLTGLAWWVPQVWIARFDSEDLYLELVLGPLMFSVNHHCQFAWT